MTNLGSVLSRDITLPTKVSIVKPMVFPVVTYGCESSTINKRRRIDGFKLVLEKTLMSPLDARRSNESILKEINPEYSIGRTVAEAEAPILGPLMRRTDSLEKTLMLGKTEGRRKRGQQRMRWLDGISDSMT